MGLLVNALPGLRAARAPFAAGALILLALWIAIGPLPSADHATGVYGSLLSLRRVFNVAGPAAVVGVAAYLAGAIVTGLTEFVSRFGMRRGMQIRLRSLKQEADDLIGAVAPGPRQTQLEQRRAALFPEEIGPVFFGQLRELALIQQEWRQTRFRLLTDHPELFAEIDRLDAEAEFRRALLLPIVLIGAAVVSRTSSVPAAIGLAVGFVLLAVGLLLAAIQLAKEAEQAVADVILDEQVTLPLIAALRRGGS